MLISCADADIANKSVLKLLDMVATQASPREVVRVLYHEFNVLSRLGAVVSSMHPQGFMTFKLGITNDMQQALRLHVWHPFERSGHDQPGFEIHNHTFGFTSLLLAGEMTNLRYAVTETEQESGKRIFDVAYNGANKDTITPRLRPVFNECTGRDHVYAGEYYTMPSGDFHRSVVPSGVLTMTLLAAKVDKAVPSPLMVGPSHFKNPITAERQKLSLDAIAYARVQLGRLSP